MASTSPHHAPAVADSVPDALGLRGALGAPNMHDMEGTRDTKHARGIKVSRGKKGAVQAVLDTTELLELTLLHLSTKDLTRTLTVSKQWQASILGSVILRRNLFLDPALTQEYLDWIKVEDGEDLPFLCKEPTETSLRIVELHPIFSDRTRHFDAPIPDEDKIQMSPYIEFGRMSCDSLRAVHPSTLLFQPPLEEMTVSFQLRVRHISRISDIKRAGGVTFGDVLEEWEPVRAEFAHGKKKREETCSIAIVRAVAPDADGVKFARGTISKAQYSAGIKELDTFYVYTPW